MATGREPLGLAMVICDAIHDDRWTNKRTLLGVRSEFEFDDFPAVIPALCVHAVVTECTGELTLKVQALNPFPEYESVIRESEARTICDDPITVIEVDFSLHDLVFPVPGDYIVDFQVNGYTVLLRRISIKAKESEETYV